MASPWAAGQATRSDRPGAFLERYAYDAYGSPRIRESCGRGDMDNDTVIDSGDFSRFSAVLAGTYWDARADMNDDGSFTSADSTLWLDKWGDWPGPPEGGPVVAQAFSDFDNPYMFQGVPHFPLATDDDATSVELPLNQHRLRDNDPVTGRWTTRDPIGYRESMNLYEYAKSNILRWLDPFGLQTVGDAWAQTFGYTSYDDMVSSMWPYHPSPPPSPPSPHVTIDQVWDGIIDWLKDEPARLAQGLGATLDGLIPALDPFEGHLYDPGDPASKASKIRGKVARYALNARRLARDAPCWGAALVIAAAILGYHCYRGTLLLRCTLTNPCYWMHVTEPEDSAKEESFDVLAGQLAGQPVTPDEFRSAVGPPDLFLTDDTGTYYIYKHRRRDGITTVAYVRFVPGQPVGVGYNVDGVNDHSRFRPFPDD